MRLELLRLSDAMSIDYDHNAHTHLAGTPGLLLPAILERCPARSLVDVGCGTGAWLRAAQESGIPDLLGLHGVAASSEQITALGIPISVQDFTGDWKLSRRFDLCLCLEVAEHLPAATAPGFIENLCACADQIAFSAAIPGQPGQHHINCRWPAFWQDLFNRCGYRCDDQIRYSIWADDRVEPWYRQNLFIARKDPAAGTEPRLLPLVHPGVHHHARKAAHDEGRRAERDLVLGGGLHAREYLRLLLRVVADRVCRRLRLGPAASAPLPQSPPAKS